MNAHITKNQAEKDFREMVGEEFLKSRDLPAKRQAWNDYVDGLQRAGEITEHQASTWAQPAFCNR